VDDGAESAPTWPAGDDAATVPVLDPSRPAAAAGRRGSRAPLIAALAAVAVIVLGGIGAGAYLLVGSDDEPQSALDDWSYRPGDYASDVPPSATAADSGEAVASPSEGDVADAGDTATGARIEPELEAGDYLQLGSFRGDGATVEAARLTEHGIDAYVVDSDGVAELLPGFKVVVAGPLAGAAERRRVLRAGDRAGIGPLDRTMTPLTVAPVPADIAGTYDGALDRTPPQPGPERTIDATFSFAADGRSGSVSYTSPRCSSELTFAETDRGTLTYDETVTAGRCADGGTWSVKPNGGELRAIWTEPGSDYFVSGDLISG
jgi:hypothetical protein